MAESIAADALQLPYVYHSVNVITGEYCEAQTDLSTGGHDPLQLRRSYHSGDSANCWRFNVPNMMTAYTDPFERILLPGREIRFEYDHAQRLTSIKSCSGDGSKQLQWMQIAYPSGSTQVCEVKTQDGRQLTYQFNQDLLLDQIICADGPICTYAYQNNRIVRREKPDGRYLRIQYDDQGKVQTLYGPLGSDQEPVLQNRFVYHDGWTEVFDALGNRAIYRYSPEKNLTEIQFDQGDCCYRVEKFFYVDGMMISRALANGEGQVLMCQTFEYDPLGQVKKEALFGDLTGKGESALVLDAQGYPIDNSVERYMKHYSYATEPPYQLLSTSEDNGLTTHYMYHPETHLISGKFTYHDGLLRVRHFYHYDEDRQLIKTTVDDGTSSDPNDLTGISLRRSTSMVLRTQHPAMGQPEVIEERYIDSSNHEEKLQQRICNTYSAEGKLILREVFAPDGTLSQSIRYTYDAMGREISATHANGSSLECTYDKNGNKIEWHQTDKDHQSIHSSCIYDFANRLIGTTETRGDGTVLTTANQYDCAGNKRASVDACGNVTEYEYDMLGRLIKTTFPAVLDGDDQPVRPIETREYDIFGRVTGVTNANGDTTHTKYNVRGKPIEVLYADGTKESFEYHLDGTLSSATARNHTRVKYAYDYLARVVGTETFDANGSCFSTSSTNYNAFQQPESSKVNEAATSTGKPAVDTSTIELKSHQSTFCNSRGQNVVQTHVTNGSGNTTITTFDALNRAESVVTKNGLGETISECEMRYDGIGNKVRETHTIFQSGQAVRLFTIRWTYGPEKHLLAVTEAAGSTQQATTSYLYDCCGQLEQLIKPDGVALVYQYDAMGRVAQMASTDGSICYQYSYDTEHHVIQVIDTVNMTVTQRTYDARNQLTQETLGNELTMAFVYDDQGRRTQVTLPDSSSISYEYDAAFPTAVHRVLANGQKITHRYVSYDLDGKLTQAELIGGVGKLQYLYDLKGRFAGIDSPYWSEAVAADGIDDSGNIIQITVQDPVGKDVRHYRYDQQQQLILEQGDVSHRYSYDSLYNRISKDDSACQLDDRNQLVAIGSVNYRYDINGCLVEKKSENNSIRYQYDALNRLVRIDSPEGSVQYSYDAFGRRLTKSNSGSVVKYLYDGTQEIGAAIDQKMIELCVRGGGRGTAIAIELGDKVYAPIHDHQGSVRCLIDLETHAVAECYRYTAFGEMQIFDPNGSQLAESAIHNPWRFANKRYDDESGFVYFGKRFLDLETGRWLTPDPLWFLDGPNRYAYGSNNPIQMQDLDGLFAFSNFWESFTMAFNNLLSTIISSVKSAVDYIQKNYSYMNYAYADIEDVCKKIFGKTCLELSGFYEDYAEEGVYGNGEISDKVRITAINGILNLREHCVYNVDALSTTHGGNNVHYVFHPSEGWTWDLIKGVMAKMGYVSPHAQLLADTWKRMIHEMGGVDGGGLIIHYAHSIGGTNTEVARTLLTPEEQKMIRVITVGSATVVPNTGFESVVNYVSSRDGVCIADPVGFLKGWFGYETNVVYIGTIFGFPFIDHMLSMETYRRLMEVLGRQFVETYSPKQ